MGNDFSTLSDMMPAPSTFRIVFCIGGVFVAVTFVIVIVMMLTRWKKWHRNNQSPRITVPATIVSKRMEVSGRHNPNDTVGHSTWTNYYATFQVESGDRMELELDGMDYGMLVEGDAGNLTFQGTRYLGFQR